MEKYRTKGTCSSAIEFEVEGGVLKFVRFIDGCSGNTQGVARLAVGRKVDEVIELLKDITCKGGPSCPAQLAQALLQYQARA